MRTWEKGGNEEHWSFGPDDGKSAFELKYFKPFGNIVNYLGDSDRMGIKLTHTCIMYTVQPLKGSEPVLSANLQRTSQL